MHGVLIAELMGKGEEEGWRASNARAAHTDVSTFYGAPSRGLTTSLGIGTDCSLRWPTLRIPRRMMETRPTHWCVSSPRRRC